MNHVSRLLGILYGFRQAPAFVGLEGNAVGRVLRTRTPAGVEQEVWALVTAYQALRTAMTDATDGAPRTDPDRAGSTAALAAARDQLVLAAGVTADTIIDLVGAIGRSAPAQLLPERRVRTEDRIVKRAISKYNARGPAIDRTTYKATISTFTTDP